MNINLEYPEEQKRIDEVNLYVYHKCPMCGKFMRKTKTLDEKLEYGNYKCNLVSIDWESGVYEHD